MVYLPTFGLIFYGRCKVNIRYMDPMGLFLGKPVDLSRICIDRGVFKDVAGIFTPKIAEMFPNLTKMFFKWVETTNDSKCTTPEVE